MSQKIIRREICLEEEQKLAIMRAALPDESTAVVNATDFIDPERKVTIPLIVEYVWTPKFRIDFYVRKIKGLMYQVVQSPESTNLNFRFDEFGIKWVRIGDSIHIKERIGFGDSFMSIGLDTPAKKAGDDVVSQLEAISERAFTQLDDDMWRVHKKLLHVQ